MAIIQGWAWKPQGAREAKAVIISTGLAIRPIGTARSEDEFSISLAQVGLNKRMDITFNEREVSMLIPHMQAFAARRRVMA